ncbi:GOLPH3/VPS74 family protein [Dietzia sp.]|uniref:GOLPH3/VPS74 family protein n=1 Tax=Dietzia sp. TaxID=1871616 RepID=UPI002FDB1D6D
MLISDDIFLLLTNERGSSANGNRSIALAGAAVADLVLHARIEIGAGKNPEIVLVDSRPVGHPVPDTVLAYVTERIAGKGKRLRLLSVMQKSGLRLEERAGIHLAEAGVVGATEKKLGGFVPMRFPLADPAPGARLRTSLGAVLSGSACTAPEAVDLSILQGVGAVRKVLSEAAAGMSGRQIKDRISSLECPADVGPAIKAAVDAVMVATMVPVFVATSAAAGSAG